MRAATRDFAHEVLLQDRLSVEAVFRVVRLANVVGDFAETTIQCVSDRSPARNEVKLLGEGARIAKATHCAKVWKQAMSASLRFP